MAAMPQSINPAWAAMGNCNRMGWRGGHPGDGRHVLTPRPASPFWGWCARRCPDIADRLPAPFGESSGETEPCTAAAAETFDQSTVYAMQAHHLGNRGDKALWWLTMLDVDRSAADFQPIYRLESAEHGA